MAIDFSDLGGKPVQDQKRIDFSDLGGVPVAGNSAPSTPQPPAQQPGLFQSILNRVGQQTQLSPDLAFSPQGLLQKGFNLAQQGAQKLGENTTENVTKLLNQPNASAVPQAARPYIAAGAGTAVAMTPDALASFAPTEGAAATDAATEAGTSVFQRSAQDAGAKALGFTKRFLKTPQNLDKARSTAQTLLDEGVITPFASPEQMAERASDLSDRSGQAIGDYLKSLNDQGKLFDPNDAIGDIEKLRPARENGQPLKGGLYDAVNQKIDNAVNTIKAFGDEPLSWSEANRLKGDLQSLANYNSNKDATLLDKVIAGRFRDSLDNALENISQQPGQDPKAFQEFLKNKQRYGAAQSAIDPLYNRISSDLGNNKISLTDLVLAAPEIAAGNPLRAASLLGAKRLFQSVGPQTKASFLNNLSPGAGGPARVISQELPQGEAPQPIFSPAPASEPAPLFRRPTIPKAASAKKEKNQQLAMARVPPEGPPDTIVTSARG